MSLRGKLCTSETPEGDCSRYFISQHRRIENGITLAVVDLAPSGSTPGADLWNKGRLQSVNRQQTARCIQLIQPLVPSGDYTEKGDLKLKLSRLILKQQRSNELTLKVAFKQPLYDRKGSVNFFARCIPTLSGVKAIKKAQTYSLVERMVSER